MHDPMTVAFEIKYPWRKYSRRQVAEMEKTTDFMTEFNRTYRESFVTIWHVDPEHDGSDDSCGWFTPKLSKAAREVCKALSFHEVHEPFFMLVEAERNNDPVMCERLMFSAFLAVSEAMVNRGIWRFRVSVRNAERWAALGAPEFASTLCFKSGHHSNWYKEGIPNTPKDDEFWREQQAESFFASIAGWILRERRWWFQKPRWHFWHWEFQIHPLQQFKRWAFERCATCARGFSWGYSPVSDHLGLHHHECCSRSALPVGVANMKAGGK